MLDAHTHKGVLINNLLAWSQAVGQASDEACRGFAGGRSRMQPALGWRASAATAPPWAMSSRSFVCEWLR